MISPRIVAICIAVAFIIVIIVLSVLYSQANKELHNIPNPTLSEKEKVQSYVLALIPIIVFTIICLIFAIISRN